MNENNFILFVSGVTVGLFAVTAAMWIVIIALRSKDNDMDVVKRLGVDVDDDDETVCSDDDYRNHSSSEAGVADGDLGVGSCV